MVAAAIMDAAGLKAILLSTFGLSSFRGNQIDAINATLQAQDSIVVLPTGMHQTQELLRSQVSD